MRGQKAAIKRSTETVDHYCTCSVPVCHSDHHLVWLRHFESTLIHSLCRQDARNVLMVSCLGKLALRYRHTNNFSFMSQFLGSAPEPEKYPTMSSSIPTLNTSSFACFRSPSSSLPGPLQLLEIYGKEATLSKGPIKEATRKHNLGRGP